VTVYSIGSDDVDDGGTIEIEESKWNSKGDVGFRLYDPSHRGLPWLQPQRKQQ
jgi:hypothetical protein